MEVARLGAELPMGTAEFILPLIIVVAACSILLTATEGEKLTLDVSNLPSFAFFKESLKREPRNAPVPRKIPENK